MRKRNIPLAVDDHIEEVQPRENVGRGGAHEAVDGQDREEDPKGRPGAERDRTVRADRERARYHLRAVSPCISIVPVTEGVNIPGEVDGAYEGDLAGDVGPAGDPACESSITRGCELRREVVEASARSAEHTDTIRIENWMKKMRGRRGEGAGDRDLRHRRRELSDGSRDRQNEEGRDEPPGLLVRIGL